MIGKYEAMVKDGFNVNSEKGFKFHVNYPAETKEVAANKKKFKRSRSVESEDFGGITVNERKNPNLPSPILRHFIQKNISNFVKTLNRKMKRIKKEEKREKRQQNFKQISNDAKSGKQGSKRASSGMYSALTHPRDEQEDNIPPTLGFHQTILMAM